MATVKFKLVVLTDGKDVYSEDLGYEPLRGLVSSYDEPSEELNGYFAQSADHSVRADIARKANLSDDTIALLGRDTHREIHSNLLSNDKFKESASTETLLGFLRADHEVAESIAGNIESYEGADQNQLVEAVLAHPQPAVRKSLAGNYSAPKRAIKALLVDTDASVRAAAKQTLDNA